MPGGHSCIESVVFLQPLLEILSSYLIHTTHFARADSRAVLSLLPCRYPRIGSFTTLKSWISKSDLGTTEEIALLPTLRESSSDHQDYASDEASNDDIHSPLRQVRLQEQVAGKMPQVASGRQQPGRQCFSHAILYLRISRPTSRPAILHFL